MENRQLLKKIENKTLTVGVIGMGYVGLPLILCFAEKGFHSIGFDIDVNKVKTLNKGKSYIKHIPGSRILFSVKKKLFEAVSDFSRLKECDAVILAVPTPLNKNREPEMQYIVSTCNSIYPRLCKGQLVVLESTTYPGTTEEVMIPILEKSGLKADKDFFVSYSPEREDPNNPEYSTETIPKIIGSTSEEGLKATEKLYKQIVHKIVPVSSARVAEAAKLLENVFRSVNIALVNELKVSFMKMGIDIWEVVEAAKTKPFGFMPFYPGPGLGGHCIPVDPFYLTWKAREYGVHTRFIELAGEINAAMPHFVVQRAMETLNIFGKPVKDSRILILGLAYKANVDDTRESPTFVIMKNLEAKGAKVDYNDPFIPVILPTREHSYFAGRKSVPVTKKYDLIIIATAHNEYKNINFEKFRIPVLDTRNLLKYKSPLFFKA